MVERTGQMLGGPDHGNMVSAKVEEIAFRVTYEWALDGEAPEFFSRTTIYGRYIWDPEQQAFVWHLGCKP